MEVPRLWVQLGLQLSAYTTTTQNLSLLDLHVSSGQHQILNPRPRPGIEPASLWILVGFVPVESQGELPIAHIFFFFFCLFRVTPSAYAGSQAMGQIRAAAVGLHHNHSNVGSKPPLPPTPQLMAMPDP